MNKFEYKGFHIKISTIIPFLMPVETGSYANSSRRKYCVRGYFLCLASLADHYRVMFRVLAADVSKLQPEH